MRTFIVLISLLFFIAPLVSVFANIIKCEHEHRSYSSVDLKIAEEINSPTSQNLKSPTTVGQFLGEEYIFCKGVASSAAKGSTKLITQFSSSTIDDAVKIVANDANKLNHLFPAKHNLGSLVDKLGGQENTVRAVLNAANGKLPASGLFNNIPVNVGGSTVFIRGNVINGVPRLGTMFIP